MDCKVIVYTSQICPYCVRAKGLLDRKGVAYEEINISTDLEMEKEMIRITGRLTVPQILIDGVPVGGCDDLYELERRGELNRLLKLDPSQQ
ncbi:MAG: glutaredoxin 3 [bacterium]|nr:glutaredoxin 3 [bacterium]